MVAKKPVTHEAIHIPQGGTALAVPRVYYYRFRDDFQGDGFADYLSSGDVLTHVNPQPPGDTADFFDDLTQAEGPADDEGNGFIAVTSRAHGALLEAGGSLSAQGVNVPEGLGVGGVDYFMPVGKHYGVFAMHYGGQIAFARTGPTMNPLARRYVEVVVKDYPAAVSVHVPVAGSGSSPHDYVLDNHFLIFVDMTEPLSPTFTRSVLGLSASRGDISLMIGAGGFITFLGSPAPVTPVAGDIIRVERVFTDETDTDHAWILNAYLNGVLISTYDNLLDGPASFPASNNAGFAIGGSGMITNSGPVNMGQWYSPSLDSFEVVTTSEPPPYAPTIAKLVAVQTYETIHKAVINLADKIVHAIAVPVKSR